MTSHPPVTGKAFLSIITPPEGMSRAELADRIARKSGIDAHTVKLRLGLVPPMIVGLVDVPAAVRTVHSIVRRGGDAFAPTMAEIESLGPTLKVRDMQLADGALAMELWRGPKLRIEPREIEILIRARTPGEASAPLGYESSARSFMGEAAGFGFADGAASSLLVSLSVGGSYGLGRAIHRIRDDLESEAFDRLPAMKAPQSMPSHKLDLHTHDGRVLQIDGDKFAYGILGEMRGHSDNVNIDRMCELFVHLNADVVVDTYFSAFLPPAGHQRLRLPMMKINNDHVAFAFYSRWSALMYRHVMGKEAKS